MTSDGEEIFRAVMGDDVDLEARRDYQYALRGQYLGKAIRLETALDVTITYWLELPLERMGFLNSHLLADTQLTTKVRIVRAIVTELTAAGVDQFAALPHEIDTVVTRRNLMAHAAAPLIHVEQNEHGLVLNLTDPDDVVRFQRDRRGRRTSHPLEASEALAHLDTTIELAERLASHVMGNDPSPQDWLPGGPS